MARNKNPFFCRWKYPKWPKSCLRRLGTSWRGPGPYDVTNRAECLSLWSLSSVWTMKLTFSLLVLIYNESYRRLRKTLRFSSKRFRRWDWLTFSSTGLTGLKEKLPELNGQYFYVLITRDWRSLDFTYFVQSVIVCTSIILLKPIPDKLKFTVYLFVT